LNINSSHSPTQISLPANLTTYTNLSLFSLQVFSSVVTLARPPISSSLHITNRSFTYASPHLWNQLPSSFRQPHSGSHHSGHKLTTLSFLVHVIFFYYIVLYRIVSYTGPDKDLVHLILCISPNLFHKSHTICGRHKSFPP